MRRAALLLAAALPAVLVAGGFAAVPARAAGPADPSPLHWRPCPAAAAPYQCADLLVPVDYRHPERGTRPIAVIRRPADDPAASLGTLVLNPGGPGTSGVEYLPVAVPLILSTLAQRFDLVSFDPRGVGASGPVRCLSDADRDALAARADPFPGRRTFGPVVRDARFVASACARQAGADLPYLSTAYAARDLDRLRAALGVERISYFGFSYGTYLGATYASLFPRRLRALALDGAVDPVQEAKDPLGKDIEQAAGFEDGLRRFLRYCDATPAECALAGDAAGRFTRLLSAVRLHPLGAPSGDPSRPVTAYTMVTGVQAALYARQSWPFLGAALRAAESGDGGLLQLASDEFRGREPGGSYGQWPDAFLTITAADRAYPAAPAAYLAAAGQAAAVAPTFGLLNVLSDLPAGLLQVQPAERFTGPFHWRSAGPPALVVGTLHDTATPYRQARAMTAQLGHAALLTFDGDGHTAYGRGSACVDAAVNAYLIALTAPAPGTTCASPAVDAGTVRAGG